MLVRGELVLKLPADRCEFLVAADAAVPFDSGQGRPLREWVVVSDEVEPDWLRLAREALAFVGPLSRERDDRHPAPGGSRAARSGACSRSPTPRPSSSCARCFGEPVDLVRTADAEALRYLAARASSDDG